MFDDMDAEDDIYCRLIMVLYFPINVYHIFLAKTQAFQWREEGACKKFNYVNILLGKCFITQVN